MFCFSICYCFNIVYVEGIFHNHVGVMRHIWLLIYFKMIYFYCDEPM